MVKESKSSIASTKKEADTNKTKHRNHKHPSKPFLPPKIIRITQLTKQINQGQYPNRKTLRNKYSQGK